MKLYIIDDNLHSVAPYEKRLTLWRGERAYVRFAVEGATKVDFAASGIDAEFSFYKEGLVKAFNGNAGWYATNVFSIMPPERLKVSSPDVLYPVTDKEEAKDLTVFWLQANVSRDATAGSFKLTITATDGDDTSTISIATDVLKLALPKAGENSFSVEYWQYPYRVAEYYGVQPFSAEHIELLKRTQGFYKEHGGVGVTVTIIEEAWGGQTYSDKNPRYPSMIKWEKASDGWHFDYTDFDKWVRLNEEVGLAEKFCCYSPMPWRNVVTYYKTGKTEKKVKKLVSAGSAAFRELWSIFLTDFIRHLDENNWFDRMYIAFDERDGVAAVLEFVSSFKNKDGKPFKLTAALSGSHLKSIDYMPYFDYLSAGTGIGRIDRDFFRKLADDRRAEGKKTTIYTATDSFPNSLTLSEPMEGYSTMLYAASCHADGFLRWALDAWVKDPLVDTTHWSFPAGDCFLVYPARDGGYLKSVRFIKLDEGMQDANKLAVLNEKSSSVSDKVDAICDAVKFDYGYEKYKYPFLCVWMRDAFWINESGRADMLKDIRDIKTAVDTLSKSVDSHKVD